jgi:hypothetical protein
MTKNESKPHPYVPSGFFMRHVVNPITIRPRTRLHLRRLPPRSPQNWERNGAMTSAG